MPLFSIADEEGPLPIATCRPDLVFDNGGGGGVVDTGKLFVMPVGVSFNITLTEFFFELRIATLLKQTINNWENEFTTGEFCGYLLGRGVLFGRSPNVSSSELSSNN